jgi:hypothetical protein
MRRGKVWLQSEQAYNIHVMYTLEKSWSFFAKQSSVMLLDISLHVASPLFAGARRGAALVSWTKYSRN